jgi:hypothetical protein
MHFYLRWSCDKENISRDSVHELGQQRNYIILNMTYIRIATEHTFETIKRSLQNCIQIKNRTHSKFAAGQELACVKQTNKQTRETSVNRNDICVISGFRRVINDVFTLLKC